MVFVVGRGSVVGVVEKDPLVAGLVDLFVCAIVVVPLLEIVVPVLEVVVPVLEVVVPVLVVVLDVVPMDVVPVVDVVTVRDVFVPRLVVVALVMATWFSLFSPTLSTS